MALLLDMTKADMPSGRHGTSSLLALLPMVGTASGCSHPEATRQFSNSVDPQSAAVRLVGKKDIVLIQPPLAMSLEWTIALLMRLIKQKSGFATPVHGYTDQAVSKMSRPRGSDSAHV